MTGFDAPREQDYGVLKPGDGSVTLRFTRQFRHPPHKVWRALTEPEHLAAWFPTTITGDFTAGGALSSASWDGLMPPMDGHMIVFDPPQGAGVRVG
jgi:uncharacterized protein YndB with AHSA1/START domain